VSLYQKQRKLGFNFQLPTIYQKGKSTGLSRFKNIESHLQQDKAFPKDLVIQFDVIVFWSTKNP
jgi:hypothetical protein